MQHISAHTSLVAVTAKNPHPLTVTGVAEAAGPDKVLPVLSDLPSPRSPTDLLSPSLTIHLPALSASVRPCGDVGEGYAKLIEVWALDACKAGSIITHHIRLSLHLSGKGEIHSCLLDLSRVMK